MKNKLYYLLCFLLFSVNVFCQATTKYTSTNLNLRSLPSTEGEVLILIPMGTSVIIEEDCDCEWIKVLYNGMTGYVYSKHLTNKPVTKSYTRKATALCRDGTYSYSLHRRGTCSHHGGVAQWF
jgi:uncharacterized protein YraI